MKKLFALLLALVLCFGLVACKPAGNNDPSTSGPGTTSTPNTSTEQTGKDPVRVTIGRPVDSENLDPVIQDGNVNIWVYTLCMEAVLNCSDDGASIETTGLAESWEVSPDGLTYTFHMYPDLKWNTGEPVLAEDFVWSYERLAHTPESTWSMLFDNYDRCEAPDNQTLIVHMKEPSPVDELTFTLFCGVICDKSYFEEVGPEVFARTLVGTGPYMFKEWNVGENLLLVKNPYYRWADTIKVDEINFKVIPDDNTRIMQLQAGEIDVMTFVPYNRMEELSNTPGLTTQIIAGTGITGIVLNCVKDGFPATDVKVRQALAMAINKEEIVTNVHYGNTQAATVYLPPNMPYSAYGKIDVPSYDVEAAKALLLDAGYPNGFKMTLSITAGSTNHEQIGTILKDQFSKINVDLTLDIVEGTMLRSMRNEFTLDAFFATWTSDIFDPSWQTKYWCQYDLVACVFTGWKDDTVETLAYQAQREMDPAKRAGMYTQIQQTFADDSPLITLYYEGYPIAMKDSITGFVQIPLGNYRFDKLAK